MNDILGTLAGVALIGSVIWLVFLNYEISFGEKTPPGYYHLPLFLFLFGLIILVAAYK